MSLNVNISGSKAHRLTGEVMLFWSFALTTETRIRDQGLPLARCYLCKAGFRPLPLPPQCSRPDVYYKWGIKTFPH